MKEKINETNYVIGTPDRKRKMRICHVNMLKLYHARVSSEMNAVKAVESPVISVAAVTELTPVTDSNSEDDGVIFRNIPQATVRLMNSEILKDLGTYIKKMILFSLFQNLNACLRMCQL